MALSECLFCAGRPIDTEHALGRQIAALFPHSEGGHTLIERFVRPGLETAERRRSVVDRAAYQLNVTCKVCNSGWLQVLDTKAKPLLTDLIPGNQTKFWPSDKLLLATWAMKVFYVFEALKPKEMVIPQEDRQRLMEQRIPGSDVEVRASCYQGSIVGDHLYANRLIKGRAPNESSPGLPVCRRFTLVLGKLVLQVLAPVPSPWGRVQPSTSFDARTGIELWPSIAGQVTWPPELCLDDMTLGPST